MLYIELVPRHLESFLEEAQYVMSTYSEVTGINVPDVVRLENRSHDAVKLLLNNGIPAIPHVRCIDRKVEETVSLIGDLINHGLKSVLLISGDVPVTQSFSIYPIRVPEVVTAVKQVFPDLMVYCALDPYRQSLQKEFDYMNEKSRAGADGFFTQPFFDLNLAEVYLDKCRDTSVFLGISPVTTEKSLNYWKTRNKTLFPSHFQIGLDYNCKLGRDLRALAASYGQQAYSMPIKIDLTTYLKGFLE